MRPWMVVAVLLALASPVSAAEGEGCAARIRRLEAAGAPYPVPGEDRPGLYEIALHGERVPLDRYLGMTAGGYYAFVSSLDDGSMRAWFQPRTNSWIQTDSSGLVRTFGEGSAVSRSGADTNVARGTAAWGLTRVEDASGNSLVVLCPPS